MSLICWLNNMISDEKWHKLTLSQQLGNIGSEIARARDWEQCHEKKLRNEALIRAMDLLDLTISDPRWKRRLREFTRFREVLADWFSDSNFYFVPPEQLEEYCIELILAERR